MNLIDNAQLSSFIESNFSEHTTRIAKRAGMRTFLSEALTWVDSGLDCDTFNIIHIRGPLCDSSDLRAAIDHFVNSSRAFCLWVAAHRLDGEGLNLLDQLGLEKKGEDWGMVLDLKEFDERSHLADDKIHKIRNLPELKMIAELLSKNWLPPDANVIRYFEMTGRYYLSDEAGLTMAAIIENEQALSGIEVFYSSNDVAGIYNLSTLLQSRKQGFGGHLMRYALAEAKQKNCTHVVLQASAEGKSLYEKLGFKILNPYFEFGLKTK